MRTELRTGDKAVFFSLMCGHIPCKITSIRKHHEYSWIEVTAIVTADTLAYKANTEVYGHPNDFAPKENVKNSKQRLGGYYVEYFKVVVDNEVA